MNLRDLYEAKALPNVSGLSWEELRQVVFTWVIHATAEAIEEEVEDGHVFTEGELIARTVNVANAFAEDLNKEVGRLSDADVKRDFKRLYPKLFNQVAKKEQK